MGTPAEGDGVVREFGVLLEAATLLERIAGRELERRCGIRHVAFEVLLRLSEADGPLTMGSLAEQLILTSGGMTRLVDRMQAAGYVRRHAAPGDRRRQLVELTDAGRAKLAEALQVHGATLDRHFAGPLAPEQRRRLVEALAVLGERARAELGSLG
ncbi:MarR family winged helix-turn-helix transcriptional regulator [Actinomadura keratinilytica]|uniref:MarR family winged helix-turn-helix transcriptional regulator n=1 Tax=Actinomadura keratinilytica TaxID=547461 RepID=A0ABP7YB52_9ACTN